MIWPTPVDKSALHPQEDTSVATIPHSEHV